MISFVMDDQVHACYNNRHGSLLWFTPTGRRARSYLQRGGGGGADALLAGVVPDGDGGADMYVE